MQRIERNRAKPDGFVALTGVDSGRSPTLLQSSQVAYAVNTTFRGGSPQPRPGFKRVLGLEFEQGRFQGATFYDSPTRPGFVVSIAGRFYFVDPIHGEVQDISISGDLNSSRAERVWYAQVEEHLVAQNGQDRAFIWNGASSRRAEDTEVPVGTIMAYGMGRLWVVRPDRRSFVAGDLVYSLTNSTRDALSFTENTFLTGGGAFTVPIRAGAINALRFVALPDTSVGQGPLIVGTDEGAFSVNAPIDRELWQLLSYPIQTVSLLSYGPLAQESFINVNSDLWYRARDGIRSLAMAQRQQNEWASTPMSKEMRRLLDFDDQGLLGYGSAILFDNRLLMTAAPFRERDYGVWHKGLAVLDFDPLSSMAQRAQPAWEGTWCGLRFLQLVKGSFNGVERAYAFALSTSNEIELWEITKADRWDNDEDNITWFFETRSFDHGTPFDRKRLETIELWRDQMAGTLRTEVSYRPDQHPCFISWHSWTECVTYRSCTLEADECPTLRNYKPQFRPRVRLPQPADTCDTNTGRPFREGSQFQLRFYFEGFCRVRQMRMQSFHVQEDPQGDCPLATDCTSLECCDEDEFPSIATTASGWTLEDGTPVTTESGEQIFL